MLRSRDGKNVSKTKLEWGFVYMRASVRKWLAGAKELSGFIVTASQLAYCKTTKQSKMINLIFESINYNFSVCF